MSERLSPAGRSGSERSDRFMSEGAESPSMPIRCRRARHRYSTVMLLRRVRCWRATAAAALPHGWLLAGSAGIGKATLAYRMARFVLAHPESQYAGSNTRDIACGG